MKARRDPEQRRQRRQRLAAEFPDDLADEFPDDLAIEFDDDELQIEQRITRFKAVFGPEPSPQLTIC